MQIYIIKVEYIIICEIKTRYYLDFSKPETMKLLENKDQKDENLENLLYLENNEIMLLYCSFVKNKYEKNSTVL